MDSQKVAVFDFDGTIVSKDTGFAFYKWLVLQSKLRTALMIIMFPLLFLLLLSKYTRVCGLSFATVIATFAERRELVSLQQAFIEHYFSCASSGAGAVVYQDALTQIITHQKNNHAVLILSGCPQWLLQPVVAHLGINNVEVIGSQQQQTQLGLIFTEHCFADNKITMAQQAGHNIAHWGWGYSDSRADLPFLNLCQQAYLINITDRIKADFAKKLTVEKQFIDWV